MTTVTAPAVLPATRVFLLCFIAGLCEGFDLLSAGIAAPKFAPVFQLAADELGQVFAASALGLFVGAILGGLLSDRIGRRWTVIGSITCFGLFSIGTALAPDTDTLLLMRLLTGLGLGGALPILLTLTAESSPQGQVAMRVTMLGSSMPLGGFIAGALTVAQPDLSWQAIFWIGGLAPLLVAALMLATLPESGSFRAEPARGGSHDLRSAFAGDGRMVPTLMLWVGAFLTSLALYLLINWLPSLMVGKGFLKPDASKVTMALTVGGAASGFVFGLLVRARRRGLLYAGTWIGMAASVIGLTLVGYNIALASLAGAGAGFFLSGGGFLLYARAAELYPAAVRGTGVGFLVGMGRLGSVAGPLMAGALLTAQLPVDTVLLAIVPLILLAMAAALVLARSR
ncbi:MFS transporter [Niveispirillum sp.]|uniref:MFS transporter n=1 Tax=Niveispirillum sp. TaxID=1917217 RepID=UPI001B680F33|nr:MFS transporter [Niveispirillum sp.]MBP7339473.1 MFS transporter [Niveispirillum sp.]